MSRSRSPSDTDRTCVDVDASSEHEAPAKQPRVGERMPMDPEREWPVIGPHLRPIVGPHEDHRLIAPCCGFRLDECVCQADTLLSSLLSSRREEDFENEVDRTPPRRLECSGSGKDESYESIAYNDACRNIQRLIVEDRAEVTRQFPEGRVDRWFFDDFQDQNGKWHSALAPPRSHWRLDAVNPVEPELDEKAMRLVERLIVGDGGPTPELTPDSTEYILCGRNGIKDKARSYRYMMIDKEIKRARKMARAELEHMNGPSENQPRGVKRKGL